MLRPPPRSPLFPYTTLFRSLVRRYNDQLGWQFDRIRDFLVLHYVATTRSDTPFWDHCRHMPIPDGLRDNIELFRDSGDRKSTRLNSSHSQISYAVFCLKKKK